MIDLNTGKRLLINAFLSVLPLSINFSVFLLSTTCLLLSMYFLSFHICLLLLRCHSMTPRKEIL